MIALKLYEYTGAIAVPTDNIGKKPLYPYLSYKVITQYVLPRYQGNYKTELIDSKDERFEHDIKETLEIQPTFTISMNAYSDDIEECRGLIQKVHDWFKHSGYYDLGDYNTVTVETSAFADRTVLVVDEYESRIGFDAILRTSDTITRSVETIEEYSIKEV